MCACEQGDKHVVSRKVRVHPKKGKTHNKVAATETVTETVLSTSGLETVCGGSNPTESTSSHNDRTRMSSRKRTKPSEAPSVRSPSPREPFPPIRTQTSRFGHSSLPSAAGTRMTSGPAALHGSSLLQISRALRSTLACNFTNARHPGRWCAEDSLYFAN